MDKQVASVLITLLVFGFIAVVVGWIIFAAIAGRKRERERTQQLLSLANLMGWQFSETAPLSWIPNLEHFPLFNQGHSKSLNNVMYGELEGMKTALFDYYYVVGHGKHRSTYNQSVVYFEMRNLRLPSFSLRPEHALHKIISAFGYQDIDFGNRPSFSSEYLLRGPEEQAVRSLFNEALLGFYEMNQGNSADGGGSQLFIFRQDHRPAPHETQAFINWALQLQRMYGRSW